jgi:hypothetical protein
VRINCPLPWRFEPGTADDTSACADPPATVVLRELPHGVWRDGGYRENIFRRLGGRLTQTAIACKIGR